MHYGQARRKQPFCGLLQSSGTSNRVVRHLAKVMIQRIGDEQMWLRVHDPRVWANLEWILQPGQFDSLLGPIQQWAWPSPLTDEWSAKVSVANTNRRLDLDIEQMRALSMVGSINNVIAKLKREALAAHGNTGLHKVAYHELLRAQKIGLNSDEDAEFFAFLSLARTPLIHEEPSAKRMIDMAIQGTCGYMSAWIDENGQAMEENVEELESYGAD
jgi:malate synthase